MVFQSYALYPHMTVYENIAFSLKLKKFPKEEIDRKVRKVAEDANQMSAEIIDLRKRIDTTLFT